ncbi:MAG TPA: hypothetical protein VF658_06420 [Pyrinomonadaceae bacterium]
MLARVGANGGTIKVPIDSGLQPHTSLTEVCGNQAFVRKRRLL